MSDRKIPHCFTCGEIISFDKERRDKSGKMIRLNPSTLEPHQCKDTPEAEEGRMMAGQIEHWPQEQEEQPKTQAATVTRLTAQFVKWFTAGNSLDSERQCNDFLATIRIYGARIMFVQTHVSGSGADTQYSVAISFEVPNEAAEQLGL